MYLKALGKVFLIALSLLLGLFGIAIWPLAMNLHFLNPILLWVTIPWILSWYIAIYLWYNEVEIVKKNGKKTVKHVDKQ